MFYIAYHHFVIVGVILLAIGSSALQGGKPDPKDFTMVKAGISILTVSWVGLVACALLTLVMNRNTGASFALHSASQVRLLYYQLCAGSLTGSQLLLSCTVALVFTGIRVIYSLVALVTQNPTLSPATGSLAVRVVLSFLPELISTLILLVGGILTRDIRKDAGPGPGQALPLKDTGRV